MDSGQLARAEITNLDTEESVQCMFNPKQYTISKSNTWSEKAIIGKEIGETPFGGGTGAKLVLDLLFDTYEAHSWYEGSTAGKDVSTYTSKLWNMMKISESTKNSEGLGRPPHCQFKWGSQWSFEAVITSISQTYTMFLPNGTPVRSTMNITFQQIAPENQYPPQNPTSGGHPGEHVHTIVEGETLAAIAFEEYGDATVWRHIAHTNRITDPRRLRAGQVLLITPVPTP